MNQLINQELLSANDNNIIHGSINRRTYQLRELLAKNPQIDPYPDGWFVIEFSKK